MNPYVIQTHRLTKNFKSFTAVDGLDLQVPAGGVYGFLGPNGAGKSTTIRMLLGLVQPSAGEVEIFGKPVRTHRLEILRQVGSLVEAPSYYGHLSAVENLDLTRRILDLPKSEIDRVLTLVDLAQTGRKPVGQFSQGMKQRLGIAQSLLGRPSLLILDEPTNGLDPAGIHEIRDLIRRLPTEMDVTILLSSHLLSEVELVASHVGIIDRGQLLFQGTLEALKEKSQAEILLDARPAAEAAVWLSASGYSVEVNGKHIHIKDEKANEAALARILVMQGYEIYHLSRRQSTLEELFLSVTREGAPA